jgi:hypothetical protein
MRPTTVIRQTVGRSTGPELRRPDHATPGAITYRVCRSRIWSLPGQCGVLGRRPRRHAPRARTSPLYLCRGSWRKYQIRYFRQEARHHGHASWPGTTEPGPSFNFCNGAVSRIVSLLGLSRRESGRKDAGILMLGHRLGGRAAKECGETGRQPVRSRAAAVNPLGAGRRCMRSRGLRLLRLRIALRRPERERYRPAVLKLGAQPPYNRKSPIARYSAKIYSLADRPGIA